LALDHSQEVDRLALLDITPTYETLRATNAEFAIAYVHWFFLAQPYDYPERTILLDPEFYLRRNLLAGPGATSESVFTKEAMDEYLRCFRDPATIHAICEDYRAAISIDRRHDEEDGGKKVTAPVLILWGEKTIVHRFFDPLRMWAERAEKVTGEPLPAGHHLCEEVPDMVASRLMSFFIESKS
jgi:haloacetate dehalogenase